MPKPSRPTPNLADTSRASDDSSRAFAIEIARMLYDDKCEDVLVLDLRGQSQITDYFVIGTGTSQRQMRSAGLHVEKLAEEKGVGVFSTNLGERDTSWFILDIAGTIVHLFESHTRGFYDLEMLWGDADRVDWRRPDQREVDQIFDDPARNRAGLRSTDLPRARPGVPVDADTDTDADAEGD